MRYLFRMHSRGESKRIQRLCPFRFFRTIIFFQSNIAFLQHVTCRHNTLNVSPAKAGVHRRILVRCSIHAALYIYETNAGRLSQATLQAEDRSRSRGAAVRCTSCRTRAQAETRVCSPTQVSAATRARIDLVESALDLPSSCHFAGKCRIANDDVWRKNISNSKRS
jgi:hypothetical protein